MRGRLRTWTDAQLVAAVAKHSNFTDVLRELGLRPAGGNHESMKRHIDRLRLDTSHFNQDRRLRGVRAFRELRRLSTAQVFCVGSHVRSSHLRRIARRFLQPVNCARCGNSGTWLGGPLTLQLHHVNGVHDDNRLENLRWLCPNCHSQTETFAGKGKAARLRALRAPSAPPPTL